MYITVNDIIGKNTIDGSYSVQGKEATVGGCTQLELTETLTLLILGVVFHLQPSKWLRTSKRNKLSP